MPELSQQTQRLIQQYQLWRQSLQSKNGMPTIHVDEVASAVASFYEKIRGVVDWKEEHLFRRAAIERALKRRLLLQKTGEEAAEPFLLELIRGGHFPNDKIEEAKINEVKDVLNKYIFIIENNPSSKNEDPDIHLYNWILGIAACEIEEIISPSIREKSLIEYMGESMKKVIQVKESKFNAKKLTEEEKDIQIYIACQRALFKLDKPIISYYFLRNKYPSWSALSDYQLKEVAGNIFSIWNNVEKELNHPLADKFYKICERVDTAFLIMGDVLSEKSSEAQKILADPARLENLIREAYQKRLSKLKGRLSRAALYSTISIFISKMLIAFVLEVPFDKYILGQFNYKNLGLNIFIPPLLMVFLVLTVKPPEKENLNKVVLEVMKIAYEKEEKEIYQIKLPGKKRIILHSVIIILYVLTFLVSFGAIVYGLKRLNFSILSMIIFLVFFSLISFAGLKIRERAKELQIVDEKSGFFAFLIDIFSLPLVQMGKWLSNQWMKYNVAVALMSALIDMPFHLFTEFLEQWRNFLKEKREEIH